MRTPLLYFLLALGAYLCQTVVYPALFVPELRVDLLLVLVIHSSFMHKRAGTLLLALFAGLLMDLGLPLKGCFHPIIYLGLALLASLLRQNLNLDSRRYQAIFLGLCAFLEGIGIWIVLTPQGAEFGEITGMLKVVAWRSAATGLIGPFLLSALACFERWVDSLTILQPSQEG